MTTGTPAATRVPAQKVRRLTHQELSMSTLVLVPHLSTAITLAYLHRTQAGQPLLAAATPHHAASGVALILLLLGLAFLASVVRVARQIAVLMSLLLQVAATAGAALVMVLIVAALAIIALLH